MSHGLSNFHGYFDEIVHELFATLAILINLWEIVTAFLQVIVKIILWVFHDALTRFVAWWWT